jgi:D-serine deaminase-like pyridoxal phosphate-dependent protein
MITTDFWCDNGAMNESLPGQPRYREVLAHLGEPDSRQRIATPALVCDLDLLAQNVQRMAVFATSSGVALRPHVKSHKSAYVAKVQLNAGAVGLAFAKLSEAEAVVDRLLDEGHSGALSVLITSPLVGDELAQRALALAQRCSLMVVVDHPDGVVELGRVSSDLETTLGVLCDVDVGLGRTGVANANEALRIVDLIVHQPGLHFSGVQGYGGHLQHIAGRDDRFAATAESTARLVGVINALEGEGHRVELRTGGGTGTAAIDVELGCLNELQCGSYVFMDREYRDALGEDPEGRFAQSLTITTSVISTNQEQFVTVDAGLKSMATDAGTPLVVGSEERSLYRFFGDEQGLLVRSPSQPLERGDRVELVPPHCDPTVDRYDIIWLVRGDVVVDVAHVDARGCSQ